MGNVTGVYVYQPEEGELRWMGETSTYFLDYGVEFVGPLPEED